MTNYERTDASMSRCLIALVCVSAVIVAGCARRFDLVAERAVLRQADGQYSQASAAGDVDRVVSMYTNDATLLPPNQPAITGVDGIRKFSVASAGLRGVSLSFLPVLVEVSSHGDMGYTVNTFKFSYTSPDGHHLTDSGRAFYVWRRQPDRSWKIAIDIWSSDVPVPASRS